MIKDTRNCSDQEKLSMLLMGVSYSMYIANKDKSNFQKFKDGKSDELTDEELTEVRILSILERLGYSIDELGTYFYKDIIFEVCEFLKGISSRRDMDKCRQLLSQLNDAFSQFYRRIARDEKEIGVKSFHLYIQSAIDKIDDSSIDLDLSSRIFGEKPEEQNYGLQAFQIASYTSQIYSYEESQQCQKPVVKKLSNLPTDIALKCKF